MSFDKYVQYKALDRLYSTQNDGFLEMALRSGDEGTQDMIKAEMKNVCALIHKSLFDQLESTCGLLEISKRKFIEMALIEMLERADKIIDEVGVIDHFVAMSKQTESVK